MRPFSLQNNEVLYHQGTIVKFRFIFVLFSLVLSLVLIVSPSISQADVFNGDISFSNCVTLCNSAGEHEIKFRTKIDFTLRII